MAMNRKDIARAAAERTGLTQKDCNAVIEALFDAHEGIVVEAVASGEEVNFQGFGKFHRVDRAARSARNPHSGEVIQVPAKSAIRFKVGSIARGSVSEAV